jgi:hypothetical protein
MTRKMARPCDDALRACANRFAVLALDEEDAQSSLVQLTTKLLREGAAADTSWPEFVDVPEELERRNERDSFEEHYLQCVVHETLVRAGLMTVMDWMCSKDDVDTLGAICEALSSE